ncbi:MAG: hypothetical protein ACK2T3_04105 [Candidatus Promineifilaceae bacterium]
MSVRFAGASILIVLLALCLAACSSSSNPLGEVGAEEASSTIVEVTATPSFIQVTATPSLARGSAVPSQIPETNKPAFVQVTTTPLFVQVTATPTFEEATATPSFSASQLPDLGLAPEFANNQWLNIDQPQTLASLRGKVVLIEFWTFG